jgi:GH25 family lysozyme M1 (1,4-beta-N-acetylmuramidase)
MPDINEEPISPLDRQLKEAELAKFKAEKNKILSEKKKLDFELYAMAAENRKRWVQKESFYKFLMVMLLGGGVVSFYIDKIISPVVSLDNYNQKKQLLAENIELDKKADTLQKQKDSVSLLHQHNIFLKSQNDSSLKALAAYQDSMSLLFAQIPETKTKDSLSIHLNRLQKAVAIQQVKSVILASSNTSARDSVMIPLLGKVSATSLLGVDVSHYNGTVDWQSLVKANVKFAYIKLSDGLSKIERNAIQNAGEARKFGLKIGYYHKCYYIRKDSILAYAHAEANNTIEALKLVPKADLPFVMDLGELYSSADELLSAEISADNLLMWINGYIQNLPADLKIAIYGNTSFLNQLPENHGLGKYPLWLAHYSHQQPRLPKGWNDLYMWQYTESAIIGPNAKIDLNVMFQ